MGRISFKKTLEAVEHIDFIYGWLAKLGAWALLPVLSALGASIWACVKGWDSLWITIAAIAAFAASLWLLRAFLSLHDLCCRKLSPNNKVVLSYKNSQPPFFDFIDGYRKYRVAIKVETRIKLHHAIGTVFSIRRWDGSQWSNCIVHNTAADIGWPRGERSREPIVIDTEDYLILFLGSEDGTKLTLFTNVEYLYYIPLQEPKGFEPGRYQIDIVFKADEIEAIKKTVEFNWTGDIKNFHMNLLQS